MAEQDFSHLFVQNRKPSKTDKQVQPIPIYRNPDSLRSGAAAIIRGASGFGPGGLIGAGIGAGGEFLAQTVEPRESYNFPVMATSGLLNAVPLGGAVKGLSRAKQIGLQAAKSAGLSGAGTLATQQAEGWNENQGLHAPTKEELISAGISTGIGGLTGGALEGAFGKAPDVIATPKPSKPSKGTNKGMSGVQLTPTSKALFDAEIAVDNHVAGFTDADYLGTANKHLEEVRKKGLDKLSPAEKQKFDRLEAELAGSVKSSRTTAIKTEEPIVETTPVNQTDSTGKKKRVSAISGKEMPSVSSPTNQPIASSEGLLTATLPRDLAGAKPRYKDKTPEFESDIDKALYIVGQKTKSKRDDDYMNFLRKTTGLSDQQIATLAERTRRGVSGLMEGGDDLKIPTMHGLAAPTVAPRSIDPSVNLAGETLHHSSEPTVELPINPLAEAHDIEPPVNVPGKRPKKSMIGNTKDAPSPLKNTSIETQEMLNAKPRKQKDKIVIEPNTMFGKALKNAKQGLREFRGIQTSMDLSFPFRQGINHVFKKEFWNSFAPMMKAAKGDADYHKIMSEIENNPYYKLGKNAGVDFTHLGDDLSQHEENLRAKWTAKWPGIKHSNYAYTAFANNLRMGVFKRFVDEAERAGATLMPNDLKKIADFVNESTGRAHLGKLEPNASTLNDIFFSPKLMVSRYRMLKRALGDPRFNVDANGNPINPVVSKMIRHKAIKSMLGVGNLALLSSAASAIGGANYNEKLDPTSPKSWLTKLSDPDTGKLKVGDTKFDFTGGYQQYTRVAAQVAKATQEFLSGNKDRGRRTSADAMGTFARNKLAPIASLIVDFASEKDSLGRPLSASRMALSRMTPLIMQDLYELAMKDGELNAETVGRVGAGGLASMFGVGVQSYEPKKRRASGSSSYSPYPKMPKVSLP